MNFPEINQITIDPAVMGGKPCVRGMRVTVGMITGLVASGASFQEILELYPYLDDEDIRAALSYASWHSKNVGFRSSTSTYSAGGFDTLYPPDINLLVKNGNKTI